MTRSMYASLAPAAPSPFACTRGRSPSKGSHTPYLVHTAAMAPVAKPVLPPMVSMSRFVPGGQIGAVEALGPAPSVRDKWFGEGLFKFFGDVR